MVLAETSGAGAPFPHCCAAHGASGGPRAPPEGLWPSSENRVPAGLRLAAARGGRRAADGDAAPAAGVRAGRDEKGRGLSED